MDEKLAKAIEFIKLLRWQYPLPSKLDEIDKFVFECEKEAAEHCGHAERQTNRVHNDWRRRSVGLRKQPQGRATEPEESCHNPYRPDAWKHSERQQRHENEHEDEREYNANQHQLCSAFNSVSSVAPAPAPAAAAQRERPLPLVLALAPASLRPR